MKRSTFLTSILAFSLNLLWMSTPALAQHGGGHAGGGGGGRVGGGGGFHGGGAYGGGGFRGGAGAYGGGYSGGYHGGPGAYAGRGSSGAFRGGNMGGRSSAAGRPWSWEGHGSRDASPGWHQFASGHSGTVRSGAQTPSGRVAGSSMARPGSVPSHQAIADGNWHSFAGPRTTASNARVETASVNRSAVLVNPGTWRGNWGWRGGWRGGWGRGWGWGWPGWNWGFGWGCCGWGWGLGWDWGLGWGWWGPGWSAWGPFWAWPPYYYDPWLDNSWLYGDASPAPYVLDPYPA